MSGSSVNAVSTPQTVAVSNTSAMHIDSTDAQELSQAFQAVVNDVKNAQASGKGFVAGGALDRDLNYAVGAGKAQIQSYYSNSLGGVGTNMNAAGLKFEDAATTQLQRLHTAASSGDNNLSEIANFAQKVVTGLSDQFSAPATTAQPATDAASTQAAVASQIASGQTAGTQGAHTAATDAGTGTIGGGDAMSGVRRALDAVKNDTTTVGKAADLGSAIDTLIRAIKGGSSETPALAPSVGTPAAAPSGDVAASDPADEASSPPSQTAPASDTPASGSADEPPTATPVSNAPTAASGGGLDASTAVGLLQALKQLSQTAARSGAPASVQDEIAKLVAEIGNMIQKGQISGVPAGGSSVPAPADNASEPKFPTLLGRASDDASRPNGESRGAHEPSLVHVLNRLQQLLEHMQPYLSNTSQGSQTMDQLAAVIGQIAQKTGAVASA